MRIKEMRTLSKTSRVAFTLMELLVVIAIIAALAALSAAATLKFVASQQEANTKSTLNKTKSQLDKAWSKVKDQAYHETIPTAVESYIRTNLASNAGNPADPNVTGRVRVIYVKLRLRQAFPMNFNEALNPSPLPPLPAYVTYLQSVGAGGGSSAATANLESSACLLMALQRGVSGAGIDPSELTSGGATGSTGSITYLTDAWGRPIFFSRVPVGSPSLNSNPYPGPGQAGANDPLDPQGYLQAGGWATVGGQLTPQAKLFVALTQQQLAGSNSSYKQAPMVGSGGQDNWIKAGTLPGFDPITFAPMPGSAALFCNP